MADGSQIAKLILYLFGKFGRFLIDFGRKVRLSSSRIVTSFGILFTRRQLAFFLQKRKLLVPEHETPHPAPAGATPARRRGGEAPILPPAGKKTHKKTASRRSFSCLEPCPWRRARRRQLKRHGLSRLRVPERHACRPQRDGRVRVRRVPVPPVAHQRHPP